ncbi:MAG: hypothetical protein ABI968_09790 [Acidobacteriota bacterium]
MSFLCLGWIVAAALNPGAPRAEPVASLHWTSHGPVVPLLFQA